MVLIQFELNPLPAAIGGCAYLLYWFIAQSIARRTQSSRDGCSNGKDIDAILAKTCDDDELDALLECEEEPELEPEGDRVEDATPPPRALPKSVSMEHERQSRMRSAKAFMAIAFVLVVADIGLRGYISGSVGNDNGEKVTNETRQILQVTRSADEAKHLSITPINDETRVAQESASQRAVGKGPGVEVDDLLAVAVRKEATEEISNDEVFTVALTRQIVETEEGDDFVRSAYYGTVMVGSPPEPFTVVFDTGSGHLILPSTYCKSETCGAHKRYRRSASETGKDINHNGNAVSAGQMRDQISVSFGTGEVTGVFVEDIVCVEGQGGSSSANAAAAVQQDGTLRPGCVTLRMIAATELSEDPFMAFQFDGILGLSLDGLSQGPEFNFLGVVAQSVRHWGGSMPHTFAVFLAENDLEQSEIALGGWADKYLEEDLSWGPVHDPEMGHWILPIRGIRIDNERLDFCDDGSCKAAVDTGTSLLAVPTDAFPEMYELLKHPAPLAGHCLGHGPMLHIELDHFTVTLGPRDYARLEPSYYDNYPVFLEDNETLMVGDRLARSDLRCLPTLMTLDLPEPLGPKLFILGEPVLRKYYTVYDGHEKQVGFARAKHYQAPSRDDLFVMAAEIDAKKSNGRSHRRRPTMFDVFRWRSELR